MKQLIKYVKVLGSKLGWRYWRVQNRCLVNPLLVLEWAASCEKDALRLDELDEALLADQNRKWAIELRRTYNRFMLK